MKVFIVNANTAVRPVAVMPLGACMVAEAAEAAGHAVVMVDLTFKKKALPLLEAALEREAPDVVGISARNIDNNDAGNPVTFFPHLLPLVRAVRERTKATVVLGGAAVGIMPEAFLRYTGADLAVLGDGEYVFPRLLSRLEKRGDARSLAGVAWMENGDFRHNEPPRPEFPEACRPPDFRKWLDLPAYRSRLATFPFQTKRGCPFRCVYCTYSISEGSEYRLCEPESVAAAVREQVRRGFREIEFVDNVFNAPYSHALAICGSLAQARTGARLQTVELNPAFIDDRLLDAMEEAGFVGIGVTAESASDRVLKGLGKGYTSQHLAAAAETVRRHTLPCLWMFMLGGPGENRKSVEETLRFARECIAPRDVAFFNAGVRIYPGTELERIARDEGTLTRPAREMFEPVTYLSPSIDPAWLAGQVRGAVKERLNFIDADSLSLSFLPGLYRFGRYAGLGQPLWKHVRFLKRGLRFLGAAV
ncbi:MAG: B12-binding domain-containing radical SAM protein [Endomicrobiales bacterium]